MPKMNVVGLVALLVMAIHAAWSHAAAAEFTLRFASTNAAQTVHFELQLELARQVLAETGGRVEIDVKPAGGYGKPPELVGMVERGDIEMAQTVAGYSPGRFPQTSVMELPFMFQSSVQGTQAIRALLAEGALDSDYATLKPIALFMLTPYPIFTTGRKFESLRSLRGLRVRANGLDSALALARLGMIPIGVPATMIAETLGDGTLDAVSLGWESMANTPGLAGGKLTDQVSVAIEAHVASPAVMIIMNKAAWQALPPDLQAALQRVSDRLALPQAQMRDAIERSQRERLVEDPRFSYFTLSPEQMADMHRRVAPALEQWKRNMARLGLDGDQLYERAKALVQQSSIALP
jgi:TRAP-type C4-dicarboxylate transport system substrate-binding protein